MRDNYTTVAQEPASFPPDTVEGMLALLIERCERLGAIISEAESVADRLSGSRPEEKGAAGKPVGVSNGLIEKLQDISSTLTAKLDRLGYAVNRSDKALGGR